MSLDNARIEGADFVIDDETDDAEIDKAEIEDAARYFDICWDTGDDDEITEIDDAGDVDFDDILPPGDLSRVSRP